MTDLIKQEKFQEGIPLATSENTTLEDCYALTHLLCYDFDEEGNFVLKKMNNLFEHEDFETIQEYIDFYKSKGYVFVII